MTSAGRVEDLLHRTDGNPFYVEELVAAADIGGSVPPTLAELILARVNGLSDPTPALLHEAAVLGELVDDMWLVELSGRPLPVVMEALQEAVSHHLLAVDGAGCRFRHALVREALYDDLLPGERERLHAAAVRLLQADQRRVPEHVRQTLLAYHASAAGDVPTAFRASVRAGAECERVFALSAAAVQYERALSLWDRVADPVAAAGMTRSTLFLRAAETVFFGSGSDRAVALAEAAFAALPDQESPERRAMMLERIGLIRMPLLQDQAAATAYERAVALVADRPPSSEKARALAGFGHYLMLHERHREAEPLLREAIAVADQVDARAVTGHALCSLGCVVVGLGRVEEGLAALRRAQEVSRENGSTADICRSYMNLSGALVQCARYDEADQCAADGVAYATETGNTFYGDGDDR